MDDVNTGKNGCKWKKVGDAGVATRLRQVHVDIHKFHLAG